MQSAIQYIDHESRSEPPPTARFARFVELVTQTYPDLSSDDLDGDDDANIWPEGIVGLRPTSAVVNVAIKTDAVDSAVLACIAAKACEAGLLMLDPQNAMLYGPEGVVMRAPIATPRTVSVAERDAPFDKTELCRMLGADSHTAWAAMGFEIGGNDAYLTLHRQHKQIRQALSFYIYGRAPVRIESSLWLSCNELTSVWLAAMNPYFASWKERRDRNSGGVAADFEYGLTDLVPASSAEEIARFRGTWEISTPDEAIDFRRRLQEFVDSKLLPVLEPLRDLRSLAALALTGDGIDTLSRGKVHVAEQLASVVLARLAMPEEFERVARGLMSNPNRAHTWREFYDAEGRLLQELLDALRARNV